MATPVTAPTDGGAPPRRDRTHFLYIAVIAAVFLGIVLGFAAPEFAKELPYVHYGSSRPGVTEVNDNILYTAVNDAVLLNTTPKDALDTAAERANKLLQQNRQKYGG